MLHPRSRLSTPQSPPPPHLAAAAAEWEVELESYVTRHPAVRVHDMPQSTYVLRNRGTMLEPMGGPGTVLAPPGGTPGAPVRCAVPPHATIAAGTAFPDALAQLQAAGMAFPVLAKSLWADGRPGSHDLAVVHTGANPAVSTLKVVYVRMCLTFFNSPVPEEGLRRIVAGDALAAAGVALPLLFEQYVNHGTCLFKVYVLGDAAVMVTRPSLHLEAREAAGIGAATAWTAPPGTSPPAPAARDLGAAAPAGPDLEVVSRVSAYPRSRSWGKDDLAPVGHGVPPPPEWVWRGMAAKIRDTLGLTLFNFDLIVPLEPPPGAAGLVAPGAPCAAEGLVHLIDINYFPGIEKLPNYEALLVGFFEGLRDRPAAAAAAT